MGSVSVEQLVAFVAVGGVLLALYNTIMTAVKNHRAEHELKTAPIEAINTKLTDHETRIVNLEGKTDGHDDEMKLLLKSQLALIRHGVDGNNISGLKESQKDIQDYLVNK